MIEATFGTDDAPDGEGAQLQVFAGGTGDWYVNVVSIDKDGLRYVSDPVRFCTSGARNPDATMAVALLGFLGAGETRRVQDCAATLARAPAQGDGWPDVPRKRVLDDMARAAEVHLTAPLRSKTTMDVAEHYAIVRAIADDIRKGMVAL